jgi:hypothetical protein
MQGVNGGSVNTPLNQARQRTGDPREALKLGAGLGAGLIPAACAIPFVTTLCPSGVTGACDVPTDGIHAAIFVGACCFYLLQVVATVVCFIWRATRPVALGLLVMLFLGPLIAGVAITYVFEARAPHADAAGPLLLLSVLAGVVARQRR